MPRLSPNQGSRLHAPGSRCRNSRAGLGCPQPPTGPGTISGPSAVGREEAWVGLPASTPCLQGPGLALGSAGASVPLRLLCHSAGWSSILRTSDPPASAPAPGPRPQRKCPRQDLPATPEQDRTPQGTGPSWLLTTRPRLAPALTVCVTRTPVSSRPLAVNGLPPPKPLSRPL